MTLLGKIKPKNGFSDIFHFSLQITLPALVFIFIRLNFIQLAIGLIVLSKWRMFAVKPRFWAANIQSNALDVMVGISWALFITASNNIYVQLVMVFGYIAWLLIIKPTKGNIAIAFQSIIGQFVGLTALYVIWPSGPLWGLTFITALVGYVAARHFLDSFNETYSKMLAYFWAYFSGTLAWVLGHWLIYYKFISQPTLILTLIAYSLGTIYYYDNFNKLNKYIRLQIFFLLIVMIVIISFFSGWANRAI